MEQHGKRLVYVFVYRIRRFDWHLVSPNLCNLVLIYESILLDDAFLYRNVGLTRRLPFETDLMEQNGVRD